MELPVWKFVALVEQWAWSNFDEKHHSELQRELLRDVEYTWITVAATSGSAPSNPLRWQENKVGESLLSVHRTKGR